MMHTSLPQPELARKINVPAAKKDRFLPQYVHGAETGLFWLL